MTCAAYLNGARRGSLPKPATSQFRAHSGRRGIGGSRVAPPPLIPRGSRLSRRASFPSTSPASPLPSSFVLRAFDHGPSKKIPQKSACKSHHYVGLWPMAGRSACRAGLSAIALATAGSLTYRKTDAARAPARAVGKAYLCSSVSICGPRSRARDLKGLTPWKINPQALTITWRRGPPGPPTPRPSSPAAPVPSWPQQPGDGGGLGGPRSACPP